MSLGRTKSYLMNQVQSILKNDIFSETAFWRTVTGKNHSQIVTIEYIGGSSTEPGGLSHSDFGMIVLQLPPLDIFKVTSKSTQLLK